MTIRSIAKSYRPKFGTPNVDLLITKLFFFFTPHLGKCSGTTGAPKGAVLTQAQSVAVIYSIVAVGSADTFAKVDHTDCYVSYLPLAHVFERAAQGLFVYTGASIGYYQVCALNGEMSHMVQLFLLSVWR